MAGRCHPRRCSTRSQWSLPRAPLKPLNRFTAAAVRFAVGLPTLIRVFQDAHYHPLQGRILEGISRLFAQNVRVYAYPATISALEERLRALSANGWELPDTGGWVTADRL